MMKRSITLISVAALAATLALAQSQSASPKSAEKRTAKSSNSNLGPEGAQLNREHSELLDLAEKAEKRGDYALAERLYVQSTKTFGIDLPSAHLPLARLYDKRGMELEALREYRVVVRGSKNAWSSSQTNPVVLTRYGDLCEKHGQPEEAAKAYASAAVPLKYKSERMPSPLPRDHTLVALKAAAHTAVALAHGSHADSEGRTHELEIAVGIDPAYWVPRFYRARDFQNRGFEAEARREADLAEKLAPESMRSVVSRMKVEERIVVPQE